MPEYHQLQPFAPRSPTAPAPPTPAYSLADPMLPLPGANDQYLQQVGYAPPAPPAASSSSHASAFSPRPLDVHPYSNAHFSHHVHHYQVEDTGMKSIGRVKRVNRRRLILFGGLGVLVAAALTVGVLFGVGVLHIPTNSDAITASSTGPTAVSFTGKKVMPVPGGVMFGAHLWGDNIDWAPSSPQEWNSFAGFNGAGFGIFSSVDADKGVRDYNLVLEKADAVKAAGAFLLLTIEPMDAKGLDMITDDVLAKIAGLAKKVNDKGVPLMLRFAHEMNGSWNPWGQHPEKYRETWKRLAKAVRAKAPMTSLVWSPNGPQGYPWSSETYAAKPGSADYAAMDTNGDGVVDANDDPYSPYFPGTDYVDWIGGSIFHFDTYPFGKNEMPKANSALDMVMGGNVSTWSIAKFAKDRNLPFGAFETGIIYYPKPVSGETGTDVNRNLKRAWLAQLLDPNLRKQSGLALAIWFEIAKTEATNLYRDFSLFKEPSVRSDIKEDFKSYTVVGAK
ncbi:hypothetical protein AMAG_04456 [Allomyces macrogynus ATCC 38327]|uniref:GH26 domain-containing protein n=1 Tax=Allomyces macrogynus (strain ATCC 38327) TaxID=578462 RepID=A0A0L0S8X8_ALLM3|nr:hypothetical protein AMAG_04456 [Allomyces macrogynus ATCC 38327]|eukprot:KNE58922.1 hypothetical protein AMAG_04456 [Allomyces macrogynus ATCC 38327]